MSVAEHKLLAAFKECSVTVKKNDPAAELSDKDKAQYQSLLQEEEYIKSAIAGVKDLGADHALLKKMRRETTKEERGWGYKQLENFKESWLQKKMDTVKKERIKLIRYVEKDSVVGTMMSFDRMVQLEGGRHNPDNIKAAVDACLYAIREGEVRMCPRTNRLKFRGVEEIDEKSHARQWEQQRQEHVESS